MNVGKFGSWLSNRLREENITYKDFASMLHLSRASLYNYACNHSKPPYTTVVAICYYLNSSPIDIWKLVEEDWNEHYLSQKNHLV